ncbi:hypothetical protein [Endozoicomonas sp.]|uniref:hypothetical protein n=1 Tax=Endozoicomonas sp. TaxID=1892382 RepID=UPI002887E9C0|nr:hypothetical protein [Endozoicomonas sp.]
MDSAPVKGDVQITDLASRRDEDLNQRVVDFIKSRQVSDFANAAKPFVSEILAAGKSLGSGVGERVFGMNPIHWVCTAGDPQAFEGLVEVIPHDQMVLMINEPNVAKPKEELSYNVSGNSGPAINKDCPDQVLVFLLNHATDELQEGYKRVFEMMKEQLKSGELEGDAVNNTGNNRFNIAAGGSKDTMMWYCDMFRPVKDKNRIPDEEASGENLTRDIECLNLSDDGSTNNASSAPEPDDQYDQEYKSYQNYINHETNSRVTPLHHAGRSLSLEKLEVFSILLAEGADQSLDKKDSRGNTPFDHLKPDKKQFDQLIKLVESNPQLLKKAESEKGGRLETIKSSLMVAYQSFIEKEQQKAEMCKMAQGGGGAGITMP